MKKLTLGLLLAAFAASAATAQDTLRIGSEGGYAPFNFINDTTGELDGFERELGDAMCARANLTCEWVINDWDTIIPNLVGGTYDAIMAGMSINDARKEIIAFTQNYLQPEASAYIALAGTDVGVLTSGVIAAQSNTIQSGYIAETGLNLLEFATPDETIAAMRNGEADAVLADKAFLVPYVTDSNGELVFIGEDVLLGEGVGVGLRQSDTELQAKLDGIITEMKADGSLNAMITKWFGEDQPIFE